MRGRAAGIPTSRKLRNLRGSARTTRLEGAQPLQARVLACLLVAAEFTDTKHPEVSPPILDPGSDLVYVLLVWNSAVAKPRLFMSVPAVYVRPWSLA